MHFVITNESHEPTLSNPLLVRIAMSLTKQMAHDFAMHWENLPQVFSVAPVGVIIPNASVFHLVDEIPEAPDALAYHTIDVHGRPVLRLGVKTILFNGGSLISGPDSISAAMSHEACETWVDGPCSIYVDYNGKKKLGYEVSDPVQGSSYEIDGISVSNFVTPRYFDAEDDVGPYDLMDTLKAPLTVAPGGYLAFDDGTQLFGENVSDFKRDQVLKYSRLARRIKKLKG